MPVNYFKSGGTFTNIDITKLEGFGEDDEVRNDVAWSTEKIDKITQEYRDGIIDLSMVKGSPFLNRNIQLRKPNIMFQYTKNEILEMQKCSKDVIYFADKYAKLRTDNGVENITVRDFQQGILEGLVEHNNCIFMASRQIGKCCSYNTDIYVNNSKVQLGELQAKQKINILVKIRNFLYKLYKKLSLLRTIIGYLIQFTEWLLYRNSELIDDKFVYHEELSGITVLSTDGYHRATDLYITKPFQVYEVRFSDGTAIECADNHIFFDIYKHTIYAKDLVYGTVLLGKYSPKVVVEVIRHPYKMCMYDITVDSKDHSYFTNDVLSHNTTTTAIFVAWYILFNRDKTVLLLGNILDTTVEIIDKVKSILFELPFFMKPGIVVNNQRSMRFDNGCRIVGRTTTKDSAIGLTVDLLYLDEFAHVAANKVDAFWRSVYPVVSARKNSHIIITSTPNGLNKFHSIWNNAIDAVAVDGKSTFFPMRVDWWQVSGRDEEWKERTIADIGLEEFNQEYGLQFFSGDNLLLNSSDIRKLYNIKTKYVTRHIDCLYLEKKFYSNRHKQSVMTDFSDYMLWHPKFLETTFKNTMPDLKSDDNYYIFGIDTSKGVGEDYHVLNIFKVTNMTVNRMLMNRNNIMQPTDLFCLVQVGMFRINTVNIETFSDIVCSIVFDLFNPEYVRVGLELNQYGILVRDKMENNSNYWDGMILYTKRNEKEEDSWEPGTDLNSNKKKSGYCEKLQQYVSKDRLITTEVTTFSELSNFGCNETRTIYRCQSGHDDTTLSTLHASVFLESLQYYEICEEIFDKITDKEYLDTFNREVIEYNEERLGERLDISPDDVEIIT